MYTNVTPTTGLIVQLTITNKTLTDNKLKVTLEGGYGNLISGRKQSFTFTGP